MKDYVEFAISIEEQEMRVRYCADWVNMALGQFGRIRYGHFEFHSPHQPPRRIPVSSTGYLSHFISMEDVEAHPSIQECATSLAIDLMRQGQAPSEDEEGAQGSLF